jgi:hypothetical protein
MCLKVSELSEGFPTLFTFLWFISSVSSFMITKGT